MTRTNARWPARSALFQGQYGTDIPLLRASSLLILTPTLIVFLIFCGTRHGGDSSDPGGASGVWAVRVPGERGSIVRPRSGVAALMAFVGAPGSDSELDGITGPLPLAPTPAKSEEAPPPL